MGVEQLLDCTGHARQGIQLALCVHLRVRLEGHLIQQVLHPQNPLLDLCTAGWEGPVRAPVAAEVPLQERMGKPESTRGACCCPQDAA